MDNKALLIIDVQNGFINEYTEKIPNLVEKLQYDYEYVWAVRLVYLENSPFITIRKFSGFEKIDKPTDLAFIPLPRTKLFVKQGYSAVTPEFIEDLQSNNINQVNLVGVDTDQCVLATALALFDIGIRPIVLADYCASTAGSEMNDIGLKLLRRAIGKQNIIKK